jgi:hypothetical protein
MTRRQLLVIASVTGVVLIIALNAGLRTVVLGVLIASVGLGLLLLARVVVALVTDEARSRFPDLVRRNLEVRR